MAETIRNALTFDVEDYFHVSAFSRTISRSDWNGYQSRVVANTHELMRLLDRCDIRATFFVLGWVAQRNPELVKDLQESGHEIACHGYSHELVYAQTAEIFRDETRLAKDILEQIIGRPVLGYRAASYSITSKSLWALDIIAQLGFSYDSSIFPVHHDRYGMPNEARHPHLRLTPGTCRIVEFPISTTEILGSRIPVAGGGYFRLLPYWMTRWGLRRINANEGKPFVFYLHPWEIDPNQPRVRAGLLAKFRHYNNIARCKGRLESLLRDFSFGTALSTLQALGLLDRNGAISKG